MLEKLFLGMGVGLLFGFALQRGRFCMYTAFRDALLIKDLTLFKAYLLALLIQIVLVHLFIQWGMVSLGASSFIVSVRGSGQISPRTSSFFTAILFDYHFPCRSPDK